MYVYMYVCMYVRLSVCRWVYCFRLASYLSSPRVTSPMPLFTSFSPLPVPRYPNFPTLPLITHLARYTISLSLLFLRQSTPENLKLGTSFMRYGRRALSVHALGSPRRERNAPGLRKRQTGIERH